MHIIFSPCGFKIGRSIGSAINFVMEIVTGEDGQMQFKENSKVSRYACRIQC